MEEDSHTQNAFVSPATEDIELRNPDDVDKRRGRGPERVGRSANGIHTSNPSPNLRNSTPAHPLPIPKTVTIEDTTAAQETQFLSFPSLSSGISESPSAKEPKSAPKSESEGVGMRKRTTFLPVTAYLSSQYAWVPQNFNWSKIKPAIRCALVAWVSVVLFVIPKIEAKLGQASFLIVIVAFLSPPSDPFMATAEREILILLLSSLSWAWCCFGIFLANLARRQYLPSATFVQAIKGQYIEAAPAVITGIFIFFGSATILWFKARQGPGPYMIPCILACLSVNITLTTSVLFPFPFYLIGRSILLPLALHSGIALLGSILVFPSTISALFTTRLAGSLSPHLSLLETHKKLLAIPPTSKSSEFGPLLATLRRETKSSETSLVPLAAAARLLKSDLIYGRFEPGDFTVFQGMCRRLAGRADGMAVYFGLVDPEREKFPGTGTAPGTRIGTPVTSAPVTPKVLSRAGSRSGSLERDLGGHAPNADGAIPLLPIPTSRWGVRSTEHNQPSSAAASTRFRAPSIAPAPATNKSTHSVAYSTTPSHLHLRQSIQQHNGHHHGHGHGHEDGTHTHHGLLHSSLRSLARSRTRKPEHVVVGTFESQRYLNLEATRLWDPNEEIWNAKVGALLKDCCEPLLEKCSLGITAAKDWLSTVRSSRFPEIFVSLGLLEPNPGSDADKIRSGVSAILDLVGHGQKRRRQEKKKREERQKKIREIRKEVADALEIFRTDQRHAVLEPYRHAFDDGHDYHDHMSASASVDLHRKQSHNDLGGHAALNPEDQGGDEYVMPAHRYLFNCYVYQYNLMQIASIIIEMLDEIIRLEEENTVCRLWTPAEHIFRWNTSSLPDSVEDAEDGDDDPDVIQGINREQVGSQPGPEIISTTLPSGYLPSKTTEPAFPSTDDLGLPRRRDPDALPPKNLLEFILGHIHSFFIGLGSGNALFGIKAGVLTVVLSLPSLIRSSAGFAYVNRFVWAIFMGQVTLQRFRGDTAFGLSARVISTFFGAIMGMVMWYISSGSGQGNPYGLAAVCAVCFPFFSYARIYWPIAPMRNIIFFITAVLVIGYSYQDQILVVPGNPGAGFSVAWKRFVLVTCGVIAAFVASFFPPSTTIRRYERNLLATTSSELGALYCSILSFANTKHQPEIQEIISSLLAVRNKLAKADAMRGNIGYEFSLKGRWPAERYQKVVDLQVGLSYSLSHLMSVLEHLDPSWSRAFLRRTRFMDPGFQGDVLAVISMISFSLRTGSPLPQITPCPLIDRFMLNYHGLDVIHKDSEEDYGLPRTLGIDTLMDEQYLMFSVGIATAFGFVSRLDRLMIAVKEIVGEHYHIHGVGAVHNPITMAPARTGIRGGGIELASNTVHLDPGHGQV